MTSRHLATFSKSETTTMSMRRVCPSRAAKRSLGASAAMPVPSVATA